MPVRKMAGLAKKQLFIKSLESMSNKKKKVQKNNKDIGDFEQIVKKATDVINKKLCINDTHFMGKTLIKNQTSKN